MCIAGSACNLPDTIMDTSTLTITLDNQGMASLQVIILKKDATPISDFSFSLTLPNGSFNGFIDSDFPKRLEGTIYFEHSIVARGMIC
jgi:hypothetical protein